MCLELGILELGWELDWTRLCIYLREHYSVSRAYYFIGHVPENQGLYHALQNAGYTLVFKPTSYRRDGKPKGNVDAELVLQAMIDYPERGKLERVLSPNRRGCSALLKRAARERLDFLENARVKIEYKR